MKTKLLLILTCLIVSYSASAQDMDEKQIRNNIYELENNLSKTIEKKIIQFVGADQIWISAQLEVDMTALKDHLKIQARRENSPTQNKRYTELPGLNLTEDGATVRDQEENKFIIATQGEPAIKYSEIIAFTKNIKITVYNKTNLERKIERVIRSLIEEKLASLKTKIDVSFNYRKAQALEEKDFSGGSKVRFDPESFSKSFQGAVVQSFENFLDKHVLSPVKWSVAVFAILAALIFSAAIYYITKSLMAINSSLGSLSQAVAPRDSHPTNIQSDKRLDLGAKAIEATANAETSDDENVRVKIIEIYENYREVVTNFFTDSMEKRNFEDIWGLGQILGEKLIVENAQISKHKNYKFFNRYLRAHLFLGSSPSADQRLYQKLMSLMLYPDVYVLNSIKLQLSKLDHVKVGSLFAELSPQHKGIVAEIIDPLHLAALINQGVIKTSSLISSDNSGYNVSSLRTLDQKITAFVQSFQVTDENAFDFLFYLGTKQFDEYLLSKRIDKKFLFENLFKAGQETVNEYIKNLSVDEIASLIPMVTDNTREHILGLLPEIKLARVVQAKRPINGEGQFIISQIYNLTLGEKLKTELLNSLQKSSESIKIAV